MRQIFPDNYFKNEDKRQFNEYLRELAIESEKDIVYPPDSIIPLFKEELRELGFDVQCELDCIDVCLIYPEETNMVALKYYKSATIRSEKLWVTNGLMCKKNVDFIPFFIEELKRYAHVDEILQIHSGQFLGYCYHKKYIDLYIDVLLNRNLDRKDTPADIRCYIVKAVSHFNDDRIKKVLCEIIHDGDVALSFQSLKALAKYKDESLRPVFDEFLKHDDKEFRKIAQKAIERLDMEKEKNNK